MRLKNYLAMVLVALYFISCSEDQTDVTARLQKIENQYKAGFVKVEGPARIPKIETTAPAWMIDFAEKQSDLDAQNALRDRARTAAVGDYEYATVTNEGGYAGCAANEVITIYMDCEDNGASTSGTAGGPWQVTPNKNIKMFFCRIASNGGTPVAPVTIYRHAVLKLGTLNPPGAAPAKTLLRYFDNEDDGGSNNSWTGEKGINSQGANTTLTFLVYAASAGGYDPIPYSPQGYQFFILSNESPTGKTKFTYYTDDEDDNNQNYWKVNGGARQDGDDSGESLLSGNNNTTFKILGNF